MDDEEGAEDEFREKREGKERRLPNRGDAPPTPGTVRWLLPVVEQLERVEAGTMNGEGEGMTETEERFDFIKVRRAFIPLP